MLKFWTYWGGIENLGRDELERLRARGQAALDVMAGELDEATLFTGERYASRTSRSSRTRSAPKPSACASPAPCARGLGRVRDRPH